MQADNSNSESKPAPNPVALGLVLSFFVPATVCYACLLVSSVAGWLKYDISGQAKLLVAIFMGLFGIAGAGIAHICLTILQPKHLLWIRCIACLLAFLLPCVITAALVQPSTEVALQTMSTAVFKWAPLPTPDHFTPLSWTVSLLLGVLPGLVALLGSCFYLQSTGNRQRVDIPVELPAVE